MYRWSLLICKRWNPKYIWHLDKCQMFSLCIRFKIEMRKVKKKKKRQANRLLWFWCCCFSSNRGFSKGKWDSHCILECWPNYALPFAITSHSSRKEEKSVGGHGFHAQQLPDWLWASHFTFHIFSILMWKRQTSAVHKCMLRETQDSKAMSETD